jgi:CxxC motif-containing protein (DUF1111 family)
MRFNSLKEYLDMTIDVRVPMRYLFFTIFAATLVACDSSTPKPKPTPPPEVKLHDPGVRLGESAAGNSLPGLDSNFQKLFAAGLVEFSKQDSVKNDGLGPTFNFISCVGCHAYPSVGGSSPGPTKDNPKPINPQYTFWQANLSKTNQIPSFIKGNDPSNPGFTPVREARFIRDENDMTVADGGVHGLFTIMGLPGAETCIDLKQPNFEKAVNEKNIIYRIPTPVFGGGLIEQIPDTAIEENRNYHFKEKESYGIRGKSNITMSGMTSTGLPNRNGNDGTIARFGWKAQNKSLLVFAGEAYNVEMGISNELFPTERNETPECQGKVAPNDRTHPENSEPMEILSDIEKFAAYMRLLAPPEPSKDMPGGSASIEKGKILFKTVGCAYCHTPKFMTGKSDIPQLDSKPVNLYSDLLLHNMGPKLADGISQGQASGDEFRTAPLWGLGQRMWFLHDGRTSDLLQAIDEHESGTGLNQSEANKTVQEFHGLPKESKQDLLNFLRSL